MNINDLVDSKLIISSNYNGNGSGNGNGNTNINTLLYNIGMCVVTFIFLLILCKYTDVEGLKLKRKSLR